MRVQCKAEGPVIQFSSLPVFQSSSSPVFEFSRSSSSWSRSLETLSGESILRGVQGVHRERSNGSLPPRRSLRRLSSPILPRLGAPVRHLGTKMPQHLPRYPKKLHLGANIFQHNSQNPPKTASRTLQRRPQRPKKQPICRFYTSAFFPKIVKNVTKNAPRTPLKLPN